MNDIAKCIVQIGNVSGRNDKIALLKRFADVPGFKEVLQFIYNPYIRTGIAAAKLKKNIGVQVGEITYKQVIEHFTTHQTGSDNDVAFAKTFVDQQTTPDTIAIATAMVTKNLKIGVTEKTLNSVYGADFIPMIGIMKGEKWIDYKDKVEGPFIVTEKLDGARRIVVKENGNVSVYSRSGIPDDGLVDIEEEAKYLPDNLVYDGELLAIGDFPNSIALRQATNSIANSKGKRTGLTFNVFDMITIADFKHGISKHPASERKSMLAALFHDKESLSRIVSEETAESWIGEVGMKHEFKFIKPVPVIGIAADASEEEVLPFALPIWEREFEGVMLNQVDGKYDLTKDRSRDLLKVKHTEEIVLEVVDIEEGRNKNEGRVGALIVDYKGNRVGVGSGITDSQRIVWFKDPTLIIGKQIELDTFGESKNAKGEVSLNCPIFKRVVGDVD